MKWRITLLAVGTIILPGLLTAGQRFQSLPGEKTLVAWVAPANLNQRGGSALTLDDGRGHFDGIVFGEIAPARWMAGSDFFHRTLRAQDAAVQETADASTLVQLAIVYRHTEISVFRNGTLYSRHEISELPTFGKESAALLGLRHLESQDGSCFAGAIDDARIYDRALTPAQISALQPNQMSEPKPVAWWNFEAGSPEDAMGAFPPGKLVGKARIENGKLVLDGHDSYLVTPPSAAAKLPGTIGPDVAEEFILNVEAPFAVAGLPKGEDVELRIFVDKYLVEVFVNDRQAVLAAHLDHQGKQRLDGFTVGAPTQLSRVEIWKLRPTNQGFHEAQKNHVWEPERN